MASVPPASGGSSAVARNDRRPLRLTPGEVPEGQYITGAHILEFSLPELTVADFQPGTLEAAARAACSYANGYLKKRYKLGLLSWGEDLVQTLADMATWHAMGRRGWNPEGNANTDPVTMKLKMALQWLVDVRDYKIDPDVTESAPAVMTPRARSDAPRGW